MNVTHAVSSGHDEIQSRGINYEENIERLIGRKILGKRCVNDHIRDDDGDILVAMTENHLDPSIFLEEQQWFVILMVGEDCKYLSQADADKEALYMQWPLWGDGIHDIGDSLWVIDESLMDDPASGIVPLTYSEPKE
jgi:hypothetical protein